jgi:outer membrane protein TolC
VRAIGSGQSSVTVGINSDSMTSDVRSNKTESFNIGVNVPFGGAAHLAPQLAATNVELNRLIADRAQLVRDLEQTHHEAEHNLQVNETELKISDELKDAAQRYLEMMLVSFSVGEIDLIDLLKVQSRAQQAILNAKERAVILQRDQAFYNQAVGVLP